MRAEPDIAATLPPTAAAVVAEVERVCGRDGLVDDAYLAEVAHAVDGFLSQCAENARVFRSGDLVLLTSRALRALGRDAAARRLLVFGSGLARGSLWEVTGGETVWTLDLKQLGAQADCGLELGLFRGLAAVIESLAELWDASAGEGVLGLRHVAEAALRVLGDAAPRPRQRQLREEIVSRCGDMLAQAARVRGWRMSPRILLVDG